MKLEKIIARIDVLNNQDPNFTEIQYMKIANEHLYSQRMSELLSFYCVGEPPELVSIACRAQHIQRWTISRHDFPEGRTGYLDWRKELKVFHAKTTANLMKDYDYSEQEIVQVSNMLTKHDIKNDPATQVVEDIACLVFIKYYFEPFVQKFEQKKLLSIVRKTWAKMSDKGHQLALELCHTIPCESAELIKLALSSA